MSSFTHYCIDVLALLEALTYASLCMEGKFEHKKSLGQHFLTSPVVPGWMCDAANLEEGETVLEIGPGTGVLTRELLLRGVRVIALEADGRAIEVLLDTFADEIASRTLVLYHSDARELSLTDIPELQGTPYKVVANIPYYLSGLLFRSVLESENHPTDLVYLVQKEVAARIARDEKESLLSLSVKVFGTPKYIKTVKKGHFTPPPKIDSAIIAVYNISHDALATTSKKDFFEVLHLGFGQKRKQLLSNLSKRFDRTTLTHIFSTCDIPERARAEDLPLIKWLSLVEALGERVASTE